MPPTRIADALNDILPRALQRRLLDLPTLLDAWAVVPEDVRGVACPGSLDGETLTILVRDDEAASLVWRRRATIRTELLNAARLPRAVLRIRPVVNPVVFGLREAKPPA